MSEVVLKVAMACEVRYAGSHPQCGAPVVHSVRNCFSWAPAPLVCAASLCMWLSRCEASQGYTTSYRLPAAAAVLQGCVGAVKRVAEKLEGVDKVDIDLAAQKVGSSSISCHCIAALH